MTENRLVFEPKDKCSICEAEYDEACGGIQGYFGVMPVTFCEWCYTSMYDMIEQDIRDNMKIESYG